MKIETFVKGGFVAVVVFVLGLAVLGSSMLQNNYGVGSVPEFSNVTNYYESTDTLESSLENQLLTVGDTEQTSDDIPDESRFWVYQGKALKAVWDAVRAPEDAKGSISQVGDYLQINPVIIGAIITFLVISFAFAMAAWWKNRRA